MLARAWKLWLVAAVAYAAGAAIEYLDPWGASSYADEMLMHLAHVVTVLFTAVIAFAFVDRLLLPHFEIGKVIWGANAPADELPRAAAIIGWFLLMASWLVAWALVFAGD